MKIKIVNGSINATLTTKQGAQGATGAGAESVIINYGDVATTLLTTMAVNDSFTFIVVNVSEAFNGVGASLSIGDSSNNSSVIASSDIDLSTPGSYCFNFKNIYSSSTQINVYFTTGDAPTTGKAIISIVKG